MNGIQGAGLALAPIGIGDISDEVEPLLSEADRKAIVMSTIDQAFKAMSANGDLRRDEPSQRHSLDTELASIALELQLAAAGSPSSAALLSSLKNCRLLREEFRTRHASKEEKAAEVQAKKEEQLQRRIDVMLDMIRDCLLTNPRMALRLAGALRQMLGSALGDNGISSGVKAQIEKCLEGVNELVKVLQKALSSGAIVMTGASTYEMTPQADAAIENALSMIQL